MSPGKVRSARWGGQPKPGRDVERRSFAGAGRRRQWPGPCVIHRAARDGRYGCFLPVTRSNYRAYNMASIPRGVSMRAAVAGVCGLLSPFLLAVTLQAQEPEIVVRELDFVGNKAIPDEVLAGRHRHHQLQLVRQLSWSGGSGWARSATSTRRSSGATSSGSTSSTAAAASPMQWSTRPCDVSRAMSSSRSASPKARRSGDDRAPGHRHRLASCLAPEHRDARPPAPGGRPVQPLSHAAERRHDRAAAAGPGLSLRLGVHRLRGQQGAASRPGESRGGSQHAER